MEKLADYTILASYSNQQVIINEYLDDDYFNARNGFFFHTISVTKTGIAFIRKGERDFFIPIESSYCFYVNDEFPNYYVWQNGSKRLEIYFP